MPDVLKFRDIAIASGEKKKTYMAVTQTPGGQPLGFPLMVVNGKKNGPILLVDGAVHGDEYESGEAIRAIWRDLDPGALAGAFVGVPVINVPAFEAGRRANPIDGINMNRIFPGKLEGFISEQLAYYFYHEILIKCDMVIDMHGGGIALAISPTVIYREIGSDELQARAKELAYATGVDLVWKGGGKWGGSINVEGMRAGKPTITVELGGEGRCLDEFVLAQRKAIENVMKYYKMIHGEPELPKERIIAPGTFGFSTKGGLFRTTKQLRDLVKKGEVIGTISDLFGEIVEEIKAPHDGIIVSQRTFPTIHAGEWTVYVGTYRIEKAG
ncbi:MAG: succinylglutamate desuccinylase/aspartoacylase family protein [Deltaproteobacteria bacterium]|nr:succinylglutamate desuccinylase/aspartoacylase family protein [Deltaproteobacteria bacterium]MBW2305392.1 succinylglutamate desuccinylase/aspartoacylase family protein [Deltaproteobacteria bacterium]